MTNSRRWPAAACHRTPSVRSGRRVAVHQHRPGDPQPPVLARPHGHAVQRHPVVDAAAAGLAHPVGGHRGNPGRARLAPGPPRPRPLRRPARSGTRASAAVAGGGCRAAAPAGWARPTRARSPAVRGALPSPRSPRAAITGSVWLTRDRTSTCSPATCDAGRQASHRSPGRAPARASDARAEWVSAAALSSTPFGSPVDPEVPMMTAVSAATPGCPERWRVHPRAR